MCPVISNSLSERKQAKNQSRVCSLPPRYANRTLLCKAKPISYIKDGIKSTNINSVIRRALI